MSPASRDEKTLRLYAAFVGACALHGALVAATYSIALEGAAPARETTAEPQATNIDLDDVQPLLVSPGEEEVRRERSIPEHPAVETPLARGPRTDALPPGGAAPVVEPAILGQHEGYSLDPGRSGEPPSERSRPNLGIGPGSWSLWVDPLEAVAPPLGPGAERNPAPASTSGGLAEALEAHDQELGLGPAGRVLSAAHEAGHADIAPTIGTATFSITVLRTGTIRVDLIAASSNVAAWRKVADTMALAIEKKPPRIDGGRNGVRIALELVAEERWPNGAPARSEGPSVALSAGSLKTSEKAIEELRKQNPAAATPSDGAPDRPPLQVHLDPPGLWLKGRGKVCAYQIGISPLGPSFVGGCDPSNIGAPPIRVVSAKVTKLTML